VPRFLWQVENMIWQTTRFDIDLARPKVMGIVNVTPDSFSDGAKHATPTEALAHAQRLLREGADLLDIGGESTRPGATPLPADEELARVMPVVQEAVRWNVPISIDTYKPEVMQAVLDAGADIVNDIWALRWRSGPAGLAGQDVIARHPRCGVCLMHMHGEPRTMQVSPMQGDVPAQAKAFLSDAVQGLCALGVAGARITLDPGIGFGKTVAQNFVLLARQSELLTLGLPLLVGWSRKSSLAQVAALPSGVSCPPGQHERMVPSVAAALLAVTRGAHIVRVHDVKETVQALKVLDAIKHPSGQQPKGPPDNMTGTAA
jgi:dihydropteroate synthase